MMMVILPVASTKVTNDPPRSNSPEPLPTGRYVHPGAVKCVVCAVAHSRPTLTSSYAPLHGAAAVINAVPYQGRPW